MEVRDPVACGACELDGIAATDDRVPGVEADLHDTGIRRLEQRRDLLRALDVGGRVRMEGRRDAPGERPARRALDAFRGALEVVAAQGRLMLSLGSARCGEPDLVLVSGENDRAAGAGP